MVVPRHMHELLLQAAPRAAERGWFEPRVMFRRRVGRMLIPPMGLGPALDKAVRHGYLTLLHDRRGRRPRYAFTPSGLEYVRTQSASQRERFVI